MVVMVVVVAASAHVVGKGGTVYWIGGGCHSRPTLSLSHNQPLSAADWSPSLASRQKSGRKKTQRPIEKKHILGLKHH